MRGNTIRENEVLLDGAGIFNQNINSAHLADNLIDGNHIVDSLGNIGFASNLEGEQGPLAYFSQGHNFISNDQNSFIVPSIGDQIGDDQQPLDPMVKALGFYGGPRNRLQFDTFDIEWFLPTYATETGSPLLDAGPAPDDTSSLRTDQRGYSRLIGGEEQNIDIGAYEAQRGFVPPSVESICTEDDFFKRLERIVLIDSTGGGFEYGENQSLSLKLSDGLIFNLASNPTVECEGTGLSDCNLSFDSQELTIQFDRNFDTTLNSISIVGLEVRAEEESEADDYFLLRSGGNAVLNGLALEDSVTYALIYALPNYHIADQVYDEAFTEDDGFWLPDGDFSIWEYGDPAGEIISGAGTWMTHLDARYPANDTSWLASPCFDLTGVEAPLVTFSKWVDTQPGLDGVVFQQSTDRGATWTTVGDNLEADDLGWFNSNSIVANPANQQTGQQYGWTGREEAWEEARIILLDQDPDALVRFRFAFASIPVVDQSISNDGFAFDDFFVGQGGQRKV
ncbi:MAG: choice-of-anchor Q domain-containing protein, partial [Bacteroidota bacterium]